MTERLNFVDWMKFLGMVLIVWGHTGSGSLIEPTEPFNPKQLGVAFFIFVLGFTLARETRPRLQVCFNRIFPVFVIGLAVAIVLSAIDWFRVGDLRESNYLPFFAGVNVVFNFFPSNPTTWYVGTYIHIILLWSVLLSRFRINKAWIAISILGEIVIRAFLMEYVGSYIAYMLIANWISILLLGIYFGQIESVQVPEKKSDFGRRFEPGVSVVILSIFLVVWGLLIDSSPLKKDFPFKRFVFDSDVSSLLVTSASVSLLYIVITLIVYRMTSGLRYRQLVHFFARNTLFIFLVHMPMIYALTPFYYSRIPSLVLRIPVNLFLFYLLPAVVSEYLFHVIPIKKVRDALWRRFWKKRDPPPLEAGI